MSLKDFEKERDESLARLQFVETLILSNENSSDFLKSTVEFGKNVRLLIQTVKELIGVVNEHSTPDNTIAADAAEYLAMVRGGIKSYIETYQAEE